MEVNNTQLVGVHAGSNIIILKPKNPMSKQEALELAAWLVVLADTEGKFGEYLDAVQQ